MCGAQIWPDGTRGKKKTEKWRNTKEKRERKTKEIKKTEKRGERIKKLQLHLIKSYC